MSKKFIFINTDGFQEESPGAYEQSDFIASSTGVSDAGKPIKLNASGLVDKSMIDFNVTEWLPSVKDADVLDPVGLTPSTGDRYLINGTGAGAWTGKDYQIAEYTGSGWAYTVPTTGCFVSADDETTLVYYFGGSTWTAKHWEKTTASTGLTMVGYDVRVATDGINDLMIDWGTGTNQVSAGDVPVADAGNYFTTDNVEAALSELYLKIKNNGVSYTVGTGGVTKGDLVYVSADDTVQVLSSLSSAAYGVGLAATTESAAGTVISLADDTVLAGVLTSATAGTPYYWTGSGYSTSMPAGSGAYVWRVGVAKNATDLHVQVELVKRNA